MTHFDAIVLLAVGILLAAVGIIMEDKNPVLRILILVPILLFALAIIVPTQLSYL